MKIMAFSYLGRMAVCLATLGMLMPQASFASNKVTSALDISLSDTGALTGRVVDAQGKGIASTVLVSFNGVVVARAKTSASGRFTVNGMRGGVHQLTAGGRTQVARVWSATGAPKSANSAALLVATPIVRSQGCGEDGCTACPTGACGAPPVFADGCGEGCGEGGLMGGGLLGGAGLFSGAGASASGLLIGGLVVGGIATAVAVAADDDDDPPASP